MGQEILQIRNLSINFQSGDKPDEVVKNISFDACWGEITVIVGESGSGKSVTAMSLLQLLPKQAEIKGQVLFCKEDKPCDLLQLSSQKITQIRGQEISMIFQEPMTSLNPLMTCGRQVMEAILLHQQVSAKEAKAQTIGLFEKVKLPQPEQIFHRYPHQISGGQKQRVMIAMAMSCHPKILLADEPTTALDVTVQQSIIKLIKEWQQETNMAVIFITHDLNLAKEIADKIIVMQQGEIVESGIAAEVLYHPKHAYTQKLLACGTNNQLHQNSGIISGTNGKSLALRVENLEIHYAQRRNFFSKTNSFYKAVDNVSFEIYEGEMIGLVGESGCGKTTLSRAILQMIKPDSGKIIFNGMDLAQQSKKIIRTVRKDLQIVFQDPYGSLNPVMAIGTAIAEALKVHRIGKNKSIRKEKVMELLEKVNLETEQYRKYPHEFSGGQRQRICIARALALNPSFIIFDESVSALDVSIRRHVLELLKQLKSDYHFTSIFVSHDLSVVHEMCDRILVMKAGKIVEAGTADEIYFSPRHPYTQKLMEAIPGKHSLK